MNILWMFFQEETWYGPFGESDEEEKTDKEDAWVIEVTDGHDYLDDLGDVHVVDVHGWGGYDEN